MEPIFPKSFRNRVAKEAVVVFFVIMIIGMVAS